MLNSFCATRDAGLFKILSDIVVLLLFGLSWSRTSGIAAPTTEARVSRKLAAFSSHIDGSTARFSLHEGLRANFGNGCTWQGLNPELAPPIALAAVAMIYLTRLNNSQLAINSDLIKFVEQNPDTVITLLNGEKILVQETVNEVVKRVVDFRQEVLSGVAIEGRVHASPLAASGALQKARCEEEG
jgi:flagellar protein FlbD